MPVVADDAVLLAVEPVLVPVPETTVLGIVASTAMVISSDADVNAAACAQHAAVAASRRGGGDGVFFAAAGCNCGCTMLVACGMLVGDPADVCVTSALTAGPCAAALTVDGGPSD